MFKYPKVLQCDNGPELIFEEQQQNTNTLIRYFWKPLTKNLSRCFCLSLSLRLSLSKSMDPEELQDPENVLIRWVKSLYRFVNKMNNTKSLRIYMKSMDVIKLDTFKLDKIYSEENVLPEDGL